ncbi:hypothetical protein [Dolichospermum circinale]|uniref:hypothetical protein n=1 Tax=Dolichospermum circinale TaxID=109265 RepID=UPI00041DA7B1|nr:hypothetical protein [Dolichospermum circinale]MDB9476222.1 hypothetical protein [Dolichospermum circinale CS-537/11]MDB9479354.1 hypothetical protein [Dolichospermum circinale CS-537/03]MDB9482891.1 hypothetical protein [Dolichospermum circinale CS-537/05]
MVIVEKFIRSTSPKSELLAAAQRLRIPTSSNSYRTSSTSPTAIAHPPHLQKAITLSKPQKSDRSPTQPQTAIASPHPKTALYSNFVLIELLHQQANKISVNIVI